ncbi:MAG: DMT family transporter [Roseovarius sp.]|nr:DMT family transporter [Roseovarius sp.]
MSLAGLVLVLAAAFCHATRNVLVKRINGGAELLWLISLFSVLIYLPLAVWIVVVQRPEFGPWSYLILVGSMILHLGYFLLLQAGYRRGDLSLVYPVARATGPLLSTSFAVMFLGESLTVQMAAGALVIVLGILMLTGGLRAGARQFSVSLAFGLGAGMLIGSYTAWDAYAVSVLIVPPLLLDYSSNVGRVVILAPAAYRARAAVGRHWRDHRGGGAGDRGAGAPWPISRSFTRSRSRRSPMSRPCAKAACSWAFSPAACCSTRGSSGSASAGRR